MNRRYDQTLPILFRFGWNLITNRHPYPYDQRLLLTNNFGDMLFFDTTDLVATTMCLKGDEWVALLRNQSLVNQDDVSWLQRRLMQFHVTEQSTIPVMLVNNKLIHIELRQYSDWLTRIVSEGKFEIMVDDQKFTLGDQKFRIDGKDAALCSSLGMWIYRHPVPYTPEYRIHNTPDQADRPLQTKKGGGKPCGSR